MVLVRVIAPFLAVLPTRAPRALLTGVLLRPILAHPVAQVVVPNHRFLLLLRPIRRPLPALLPLLVVALLF